MVNRLLLVVIAALLATCAGLLAWIGGELQRSAASQRKSYALQQEAYALQQDAYKLLPKPRKDFHRIGGKVIPELLHPAHNWASDYDLKELERQLAE